MTVDLKRKEPKVINGIYGVPKDDDKQIFIIDAQKANSYYQASRDIALPNPGLLAELSINEGAEIYLCKSDVANFYNRLGILLWLRAYFGLPSVGEGRQGRCLTMQVLPMGWSHSLYLAQKIHEKVVLFAPPPN